MKQIKKPIVFTMKGCPHCVKLKEQLTISGIEFEEVDIDEKRSSSIIRKDWKFPSTDLLEYISDDSEDIDENIPLYESFSKSVDSEYLPAVVIGKKAFLPERSFKKIDDGVKMIKLYLQELSDRENRSD